MHFTTFINKLQERLQEPLPGAAVQDKMQASLRYPNNWRPKAKTAKKAGVLLLLYPHNTSIYTALMQRTEDGYAHSGQISLPGGRYEEADDNLIQTALRETEEEFGVARHLPSIIGSLSELYITASNTLVLPSIASLTERPTFSPDPKEVAQIIEVDLQHLSDKNIISKKVITHKAGYYSVEAPFYNIHQQHTLWGATARMMSEFLHLIEEIGYGNSETGDGRLEI